MKKQFTLCMILLFTALFATAQDLQNADMETWKELAPNIVGPEGWITQNQRTENYNRIYSIKSEHAYNGDYAMKMVNHIVGGGACYSSSLRLGTFDPNNPDAHGIAFTGRPTGMAFHYTYQGAYEHVPALEGTAVLGKAEIQLIKLDPSTGEKIIIGKGVNYFGSQDNTTEFQLMEVEVEYFSDETPEILEIYFKNPCDNLPESQFTIDYVGLTGLNLNVTNTDDLTLLNEVIAFPNPAKNNLTFKSILDNNKDTDIQIFTLQGRQVAEFSFLENEKTIDVSNWSNGLYLFSIIQEEKIIDTKKFNIQN